MGKEGLGDALVLVSTLNLGCPGGIGFPLLRGPAALVVQDQLVPGTEQASSPFSLSHYANQHPGNTEAPNVPRVHASWAPPAWKAPC